MSAPKINQLNRWRVATVLLVIALTLSLFVVLYQAEVGPRSGVAAQPSFIDVSIEGARTKLGVNDPETFTAVVNKTGTYLSKGCYDGNLEYSWSIMPDDNKTKLTPDMDQCTLEFLAATEDAYSLSCTVKDKVCGNQGSGSLAVYDPYTSPNLYLGAYGAPYSYLVETDGLGWYRAINGQTGAVSWSSTNVSYIANTLSGNDIHLCFSSGTFVFSAPLSLRGYDNFTITGQGIGATFLQESSGVNLDCVVRFGKYTDSLVSGFIMRDLTIDANGANNPTALDTVVIENAQNVIIENVVILRGYRISYDSLYCFNTSNAHISNIVTDWSLGCNTLIDSVVNGVTATDGAFAFSQCENCTINNIIQNRVLEDVDEPKFDGTGYSQGLTVSNIILNNPLYFGIGHIENSSFSNIIVNQGVTYGIRFDSTAAKLTFSGGVITSGAGATCSVYMLGQQISLKDFDICASGTQAIIVSGAANRIIDNRISGAATYSLSANQANATIINQNQIFGGAGIYIHNTYFSDISFNIFNGTSIGMVIETSSFNTLFGNKMYSVVNRGFDLTSANNNVFSGDIVNAGSYGLYETTSDYNTIIGCYFNQGVNVSGANSHINQTWTSGTVWHP